jgi:hypothetical protein
MSKGKQRSGNKADRQKSEDEFDPERAEGFAFSGRKGPRFIEEIMGQEKNGLNHHDKTDYAFSNTHDGLDSLSRYSDSWHFPPGDSPADYPTRMQFSLNKGVIRLG